MYTYTIVGGGGGALPTSPHPLNTCSHNTATRRPPHPSNTQQHTTTHNNTQQHTTTDNNTQQHYTTAPGYIKLPMYQLFLCRLYLMVLRSATSLLGALEGVGPENLDFFGPKWHSLLRHKNNRYINSYYAPVIYTAPCIMFWMRAYTLRGEVGGVWALEFASFLGPVKWERADR
jgi:hypothetical protein